MKSWVFGAAVAAGLSCQVFGGAKFGVELKVNGYAGSSTLENFPVLVKLAEYDESAGTGIKGFDVSGGKGRSGTDAEDGESGSFYLVRRTGFAVIVK